MKIKNLYVAELRVPKSVGTIQKINREGCSIFTKLVRPNNGKYCDVFTGEPYQLGGGLGEVRITHLRPLREYYFPFGLKKRNVHWDSVNVEVLVKKLNH